MTFTIEPMLNAGKRQVKLLKDGWTVVTRDRSLSAQWEHTMLVTEHGVAQPTPQAIARSIVDLDHPVVVGEHVPGGHRLHRWPGLRQWQHRRRQRAV